MCDEGLRPDIDLNAGDLRKAFHGTVDPRSRVGIDIAANDHRAQPTEAKLCTSCRK